MIIQNEGHENALATETKKINETEQYLLICKVTEITKCIVLDCSSLAVGYTKELLRQLERLKGVA